MISGYITLNPVRAGIVEEPAAYRWCGYAEAVAGGAHRNRAREGLVRALLHEQGAGFDASLWPEASRLHRRLLREALKRKPGDAAARVRGAGNESGAEAALSRELGAAAVLMLRIRHFSKGVVLGSREFVNEVFAGLRGLRDEDGKHRHRFSSGRKDGARRLRGRASAAGGVLWSLRDLRVDA